VEGVSFGRGKSVRSYAVDARGRVRVVSIGRRGREAFLSRIERGQKKGEWISILLFLLLKPRVLLPKSFFLL